MLLVTNENENETETADVNSVNDAADETVAAVDLEILEHLLNMTTAFETGLPLGNDWTPEETAKLRDLYSKLGGDYPSTETDLNQDKLFE